LYTRLGFDLTDVKRLKAMIEANGKLESRLFVNNEIDYSKQFSDWHVHLAANFCAKEAYFKALGTGLAGHRWKDLELSHKPNGEPFLIFEGKPINGQVSLSHTGDIAGAVVILFE
jgi:holo-[acyl-carrier protein] synthase